MQNKVPELWIRERGKMFEEYFFALGDVCQKMRAEKLRKVAGKYIYKRVFVYICNWKWSITRSNDGRMLVSRKNIRRIFFHAY